MNTHRLKKYEKIRGFKEKQLELLKQQIGAQQSVIASLQQKHERLLETIDAVEKQFRPIVSNLTFHQASGNALIHLQQKSTAVKSEIANAREQLEHLLLTYRHQDQEIKSWEKLVQQQHDEIAMLTRNLEMRTADERFLVTQFMTGE